MHSRSHSDIHTDTHDLTHRIRCENTPPLLCLLRCCWPSGRDIILLLQRRDVTFNGRAVVPGLSGPKPHMQSGRRMNFTAELHLDIWDMYLKLTVTAGQSFALFGSYLFWLFFFMSNLRSLKIRHSSRWQIQTVLGGQLPQWRYPFVHLFFLPERRLAGRAVCLLFAQLILFGLLHTL